MRQEKIKFALRATMFLTLALLPLMPDLLSPFGHYNFRTWESMTTAMLNTDRPFYVDTFVEREEVGDLGFRTPFAVKKKVIWKTDVHGYRNAESHDRSDIIVVGDSSIVGSSLTQDDTFPVQLSKKTGKTVYSFAPATINDFANETRFQKNPPHIVIFARGESRLYEIPPLDVETPPKKDPASFLFIEKLEDFLDSLFKFSFYRTKFADLSYDPFPKNILPFLLDPHHPKMLFTAAALPARYKNRNNLHQIITIIEEYHHFFAEKEIEFIVMPIPDKETIYSKKLPQILSDYWDYNNFLNELFFELDKRQIKTIKLYDPFMREKELVFHLDDTHWNKKGVQLAVDETMVLLDRLVVK